MAEKQSLAQFIDRLSLNSYEKEALLFLARIERASALEIYRNTHVPKGRIYDVLQGLIHRSFVTELPLKPKQYFINDIRKALTAYLQKEQQILEEKSALIAKLEIPQKDVVFTAKTPSVEVFVGRTAHMGAVVRFRDVASKELLQIAPLFEGTFSTRLAMQRALHRGVRIKILTTAVVSRNSINIKACLDLGGEVRMLPDLEPIGILIRDSEELLLGVQNRERKEERMNISTGNKALLQVLRMHFLDLWEKATPVRPKDLKKQ